MLFVFCFFSSYVLRFRITTAEFKKVKTIDFLQITLTSIPFSLTELSQTEKPEFSQMWLTSAWTSSVKLSVCMKSEAECVMFSWKLTKTVWLDPAWPWNDSDCYCVHITYGDFPQQEILNRCQTHFLILNTPLHTQYIHSDSTVNS